MTKIEGLLMPIKTSGLNFTTISDCKSLASMFGPKKDIPRMPLLIVGRLQRYSIFLSECDFKIEYVASNRNSY